MTDKDQFTFEDDDDFPATSLGSGKPSGDLDLGDDGFPETDLSAAFADGEHAAEGLAAAPAGGPAKGGAASRTRILLMILLLVVAGGAGAYYFMNLGGTTPTVPTVAVPPQPVKTVALPPQPAQTPAPAEPAAQPVTVAVPPPPVEPAAAGPAQDTAAQPVTAAVPAPAPPVAETKPAAAETKPAAAETKPAPVQQVAAVAAPAVEPPKETAPAMSVAQVAGGAFALDAGSYLLEANRDVLIAKIRKLGYEPLITPVDATLDMTRLRLGTFDKNEIQEALAFARSIEPGSYSTPAGDRFVIYAGTFLKSGNIDKLTKRFTAEGIKVYPEPVQVVRTLSRIRFGSFATREDAAAAAEEVDKAGLKTVVVSAK